RRAPTDITATAWTWWGSRRASTRATTWSGTRRRRSRRVTRSPTWRSTSARSWRARATTPPPTARPSSRTARARSPGEQRELQAGLSLAHERVDPHVRLDLGHALAPLPRAAEHELADHAQADAAARGEVVERDRGAGAHLDAPVQP